MAKTDPAQGTVNGCLMRGGTSRGFFVRESALPVALDDSLLDEFALELFGSPDPIQVDGIGGSHSHTSKLMVVSPSKREDIVIDYTFGQVAVERPLVDWSGNCGNLTSAIGPFAIREGLAAVEEPATTLRLYNTNTKTTIEQTIPVVDGTPAVYGDYRIDGVTGTGARINSRFLDPVGTVFDSLFPTGSVEDTVTLDETDVSVSVVDVTNPCVFVRANELGLMGTELPSALRGEPSLLDNLERIRGHVCERLGIVDDPANASIESPSTPFIAMVAPPQRYNTSAGDTIRTTDFDITARIITSQSPHHAYAMTGAMCLAAATQLKGTIPNEVVRSTVDGDPIRIGHPKGTIAVTVDVSDSETIDCVTVGRTARPILNGQAYYRYVDELESLR